MRHWGVDIGRRTLRRVLEQFAAGELAPGGGTAAGLAGAVGVSLLRKAASLSRGVDGASPHGELAAAVARLGPIGDRLLQLAQDDVDAYAAVLAALRSPRETADQQQERAAALQQALRGATDVPLDIMQACDDALRCGALIAPRVTAGARNGLAIGADLLGVTLRGAGGAVEANLRHMTTPDRAVLAERRRRLESDASANLRSCHLLAGTDSMSIGR